MRRDAPVIPLAVPRSRLPADSHARHAALREYFCDKDARAELDGDRWRLSFAWSDDPERYVDPDLPAGLVWWGTDLKAMPLARTQRGRVQFCLFDTWTLQGWSEWLAAGAARGETTGRVVILHVDDHTDFMPPRLFRHGGTWVDGIAGDAVDLAAPDTVTKAITSGAIGMGSFMVPFLHRTPAVEVRHLRQRTPTSTARIVPSEWKDNLLLPSARRPAVELRPVDAGGELPPLLYRVTADVDVWLADLPEAPLLLHVDMDFFSNRFNGDSAWRDHEERLDPPLDETLRRIDQVCAALANSRVSETLADVTIAFSPGFFPAEFWPAAYERLRHGLGFLDAPQQTPNT